LDKQAANQLILAINELNRRLGMMGANQRPGWMRDGDSNARYGGTDSSGEKLLDKMREQRKVFDDTTKVQTRFMRTMAEGVPIIGNIVKVIGKQTEDLKMSMRGQSDAYKNAALATEEYAYRVGQNSDDLYTIHQTLSNVQKKASDLAKIVQNRASIEKRISENAKTAKIGAQKVKLEKDLSNISEVLKEAQKKLRLEKNAPVEGNIKEIIKDLKELKKVPDLFSDIKDELAKKDVQEAIRKDQSLAAIMKPIVDGLGKDVGEASDNIKEYSKSINETVKGSFNTLAGIMQKSLDDVVQSRNDLNNTLSNLGASIAASVGVAAKQEAVMFMERQRLTGSTTSTAMRGEAITMGVSETELLTSLAENRFQMRRLGQAEGFGGAAEFMESSAFEQMRQTAYEMGYTGKAALDAIMQTTDVLRRVGADSSVQAVSSTIKFIKETHKELGVSQEEMAGFFSDMMKDTEGLRLLAGARDGGGFASIEAMNEEIEMRGKLARVLNQDLEIQKKRLNEQKSLAFGDPAEALRRSIGGSILARQVGMPSEDANLLRRYMTSGGQDMNEPDLLRAKIARENIEILTGKALSEAATKGEAGFGERALLTAFMGQLGLDVDSALGAYTRSGGGKLITNEEQLLAAEAARTQEPVEPVGPAMKTAIGAIETAQGVLKSSIGQAAAVITGSIVTTSGGIIASIFATRMGLGLSPLGRAGGAISRAGGAVVGAAKRIGVRGAIRGLGRASVPVSVGFLAHDVYKGVNAGMSIRSSRQAETRARRGSIGSLDRMISTMQERGLTHHPNGRSLEEMIAMRNQLAGSKGPDTASANSIPSLIGVSNDPTIQRILNETGPGKSSTRPPSSSLLSGEHQIQLSSAFRGGEAITLAEMMSSSRRPTDPNSTWGADIGLDDRQGMRKLAEDGIINFSQSSDFSNTTDIAGLREMKEYLEEDGSLERTGEREAVEMIREKLDQLIGVNEEGNQITLSTADKEFRARREMSEEDQRKAVDEGINSVVSTQLENARRRAASYS